MAKNEPVVLQYRPKDNTVCQLHQDGECDGVNCEPYKCEKIVSYAETICAETADLYLG